MYKLRKYTIAREAIVSLDELDRYQINEIAGAPIAPNKD
jgi:hypothetical protein